MEDPSMIADEPLPGRGTSRPFTWVKQPREASQRRAMKEERDSDLAHQLRIEWLREYTDWIITTTEFRDHWDDPRFDLETLPDGWEFKQWRAKKIREKLLTARRRGVR